jgi:hypothetical protein
VSGVEAWVGYLKGRIQIMGKYEPMNRTYVFLSNGLNAFDPCRTTEVTANTHVLYGSLYPLVAGIAKRKVTYRAIRM